MTKATVSTDLLQAFQIITKLRIDTVGENLGVLAIDDIALTIEEPGWDLVLSWVLDDSNNSLELFGSEFAGTAMRLVFNPAEIRACSYRLLRSTSAFLQTKFEYLRPTPLIFVNAYIVFCLPSTLVLRRRKIC